MYKKNIFWCIIIFLSACKPINQNIDDEALPWKLLLDNKTYVTKQLLQYGRQTITFISTQQKVGGNIDTSYLNGTQVDWNIYLKPFVNASLYDSLYDRKYRVTQLQDSNAGQVKLTYLPSFSNLPVSKMFLTIDALDDKITSVYIERKKVELLKTTQHKILYIPGKLIQLQTETKPLLGKPVHTVQQLIFMG